MICGQYTKYCCAELYNIVDTSYILFSTIMNIHAHSLSFANKVEQEEMRESGYFLK